MPPSIRLGPFCPETVAVTTELDHMLTVGRELRWSVTALKLIPAGYRRAVEAAGGL
jgi:hypothetical protein